MRLERRPGNATRALELERVYRDLTGEFKPFYEIAAELYDRHGTMRLVHAEVVRMGVRACPKTVSLWINRGQNERRKALAGAAA